MACKFRTLFPETWLKMADGRKRKHSWRSLRGRQNHARVLFAFKDGGDTELDDRYPKGKTNAGPGWRRRRKAGEA